MCKHVLHGILADVDYYIDWPNLYEKKYGVEKGEWGKEKWKTEIRKSAAFLGIVFITQIVKHIVLETQACFKSTDNRYTYYFIIMPSHS